MVERQEVRVQVEDRVLTLVNLEKVMYPRTGTTKAEVLQYYAQVAPRLLPLLADRPATRIRWPHGTGEGSFFEKNVPGRVPSWVRVVSIPTSGSRAAQPGDGVLRLPVIDSLATLTYLVNLASLELHVPQWRVDDDGVPQQPDRLVIDLDPGEPAGLMECAQAALLVRERLARDGLDCVPVSSGGKGLHLYASLPDREQSSDQVRDYVKAVAEELAAAHPRLLLSQMTKARRTGRVFFDWSQNTAAKTTLTPYSLRGREVPYVAAPRTWSEIEEGAADPLGLEQIRFDEVLDRPADLFPFS